eukprot:scaffold153893_cov47-Cyclotella_meneghiniana.AAC.1
MSKFSGYDVSKANLARTIQKRIGRPNTKDFIHYVKSNLLPNCPVTVQDVRNAEVIWGPDLGSLKGNTVRRKSPVVTVPTSNIPLGIMQKYRHVTLSTDVMKVNGIPFLMTISKHIKFGSAGRLVDMKNATILNHFKVIFGVYAMRGFKVTIILADNQFEPMRGEIADLGAIVNVVSRDEHVPEIERYNRTIKDRVRSQYNVLPFEYMPPVLICELVYACVFWRNMFALNGGISPTQSPAEIILNGKLDFNAHCKVEFGEYVQTHEEHDNSMATRTVGAIATRPTGNSQGGYYFVRLDTGRRIIRRDWTTLPMPDVVVDQVHRLARRAKSNKTLAFTNIHNEDLDVLYANVTSFDDIDLDDEPEGVETPGVDVETPGVDDDDVDAPGVDDATPGVDNETQGVDDDNRTYGNMNLRKQSRKDYDVFDDEDHEITLLQFNDGELQEDKFNRLDAEYTFLTESLEWKIGLEEKEQANESIESRERSIKNIAAYLFVTEQMNWKAGLKLFEEKGEDAIMSELHQIHDIEGFDPKHWYELTPEQRARALKYLMYLKEKRDGRIKG